MPYYLICDISKKPALVNFDFLNVKISLKIPLFAGCFQQFFKIQQIIF